MAIISSGIIGFNQYEQQAFKAGELRIYRIFNFDRFIDVLRSKKLGMVKPSIWEDPYENPLNRLISDASKGRKFFPLHFQDGLFAQCWSFNQESDALWRIYSPDKRGVLVTACAQRLIELGTTQFGPPLEQVFLGKVQYHTQSELKKMLESHDFLRSILRAPMYSYISPSVLLHKRDSFKHEEEVRLILSRHISEVAGDVAYLNVPLSEVFMKVTLDPRLTDEQFERMSYLITCVGYDGEIERSSLYATPALNLEIPSMEWLYKDSL